MPKPTPAKANVQPILDTPEFGADTASVRNTPDAGQHAPERHWEARASDRNPSPGEERRSRRSRRHRNEVERSRVRRAGPHLLEIEGDEEEDWRRSRSKWRTPRSWIRLKAGFGSTGPPERDWRPAARRGRTRPPPRSPRRRAGRSTKLRTRRSPRRSPRTMPKPSTPAPSRNPGKSSRLSKGSEFSGSTRGPRPWQPSRRRR